MARLIDRLIRPVAQERGIYSVPWEHLNYDGHTYTGVSFLNGAQTWGPTEQMWGYGAAEALTSNGVAYGIFRQRLELFAQGRFRFRRFGNPRPTMADSFSSSALAPLEPNRWLFEQCELGVARAGAAFFVFDGSVLRSLPAEWCTIVAGSNRDPKDPALAWDAHPTGLIYDPQNGTEAEVWRWEEVFAYIPETDPVARWRGISWLRPAMEDIGADNGARRYLTRFYTNHATPNSAVVFPPEVTEEKIKIFRDLFLAKYQGVENAFRTAFLGGGADVKVIGAPLKDLDSEAVRQQVHKDMCTAAGVPVVAAGVEQGTYANSKESKRALADMKIRYLWAVAAETFAPAIAVPGGSELYVETAHIAALQADALDDANVLETQARTMRTLWDGGGEPTSVITSVIKGDLSSLAHTGKLSVQLLSGDGADPAASTEEDDGESGVRNLTEMLQKIYLSVGTVIDTQEAREILNRAGAKLSTTPPPGATTGRPTGSFAGAGDETSEVPATNGKANVGGGTNG